ncbi:MAG: glycosyltransferase family 4 protein, partial [Alteromonas sp.]|nr:glycosyltransferase family 4 protein [Alteromonas sp.]
RAALKKEQCNAVVSFMDATNVTTVLASLGLPVRVVVSERIHPGYHRSGIVWAVVRKLVYRLADEVVVQTQQIADWVMANTSAKSVVIIPNFLVNMDTGVISSKVPRSKRIMAAGRLNKQKGFDLLIGAFQLIANEASMGDWSLDIFGEGPERADLQSQIKENGLEHKIRLRGRSEQLSHEMEASEIFVLSSRNEGFPNVLLEAMHAGCAVCGIASVSGVQELIRHNDSGLLVKDGDPNTLSRALLTLCENASLRQKLSYGARERVKRFGVKEVMPLWLTAIGKN